MAAGAPHAMPATVLLMDDSPTIRSVLKVHLMGKDLEFVEAETAERGLQILKLVVVRLVIADVNMPGIGGIEFVKQLRADPRPELRRLPIILLTSDRSPEVHERGMKAGASAFLHKPVSSQHLLDVIDGALR
jgi:two-component system chemotaxis response regulator CheY